LSIESSGITAFAVKSGANLPIYTVILALLINL
jgi:hypothetical protein